VRVTRPGRSTLLRAADRFRVDRTPALFGDLKVLFGPSCLG